jgi:hypothetical protein
VKNKTFFFALWDQNISYLRQIINTHVLTKEARQGIFRFWEGWADRSVDPINNPTSFITAAGQANPSIASVDLAGRPLRPPSWPDGTPYTGRLVCFSVFGMVKTDGRVHRFHPGKRATTGFAIRRASIWQKEA